MGFLYKIALKGLLNPMLQEKVRIMTEEVENIHPYVTLVNPYLRLFFQGIADDPRCGDFLKALVQGNKESFRQVSRMFVFWFFYNLDRYILRNEKDLLKDPEVEKYFSKVWYLSSLDLEEIAQLTDNLKIEERLLTFNKSICSAVRDEKILTCLMLNVSPHALDSIKTVLSLDTEQLIKLS